MIEKKIYPTCSEEYFLFSTFPLSLGIAPITFFQLLLTSNIEESLNLTAIGMLRISVAEFIIYTLQNRNLTRVFAIQCLQNDVNSYSPLVIKFSELKVSVNLTGIFHI